MNCPGACPGARDPQCRGYPDLEIKLLWPDGTISDQWCNAWFDEGAGWWRKKGEREWREIDGRIFPRPLCHPDHENLYAGVATRKRLAIIGSRQYPRLGLVTEFVRKLKKTTIVVSGGAPGVDQVAVGEAKVVGLDFEEMPADWKNLGKKAGAIRNRRMIDAVDGAVAFWDGQSPGTLDCVGYARKKGKLIVVYGPSGEILERADVVR